MIRYLRYVLLLGIWCLPEVCLAEDKLTLQRLLASSARHYPEIQQALAKVMAAEGSITAAEGAFDLRVDGNASSRLNGYYGGDQAQALLVKPIPEMNAQFYGGYRLSDNNFPIYEDQLVTSDGGEASIGVALSLLRDRDIDSDRATLGKREIAYEMAKLSALQTQLSVQRRAIQAYARWIATGEILAVYRELLELAQKRDSALRQRTERGDLAEITVTENRQFILQRQAALREAERQFNNASNELALFWRGESGMMRTITASMLPEIHAALPQEELVRGDAAIRTLISQRPDITLLEKAAGAEEVNRRMGENSLLPKLDVKLENNNDFGDGDIPGREGNETKLGLNLSFPLQTRFGRGQIRQAEESIRSLQFQKNLLEDQIVVEVKNLEENLDALQSFVELSAEEVVVTRQMEAAERERFQNGRSDFFVVNLREVNTANAQVKNIEARQKYHQALADYYAATIAVEPLGLSASLTAM